MKDKGHSITSMIQTISFRYRLHKISMNVDYSLTLIRKNSQKQ